MRVEGLVLLFLFLLYMWFEMVACLDFHGTLYISFMFRLIELMDRCDLDCTRRLALRQTLSLF